MSNIIDSIRLSGVTYTLSAETSGGNNVVELTQAQYDALVDKDPTAFYIITDATAGDLTQYWTSAQTQSAITSAVSTKQDTLVSGTNIKTINNESILGSGNIDIQGGGSSYTAGDGIDITNDVISVTGKVDTTTYNTYTAATDTALASKADTATTYTKTEVDNAITAATSTKQDTLVSGTNIKTINNESILGSGNIDIQGGGGSTYTAGRGIDITNDTISFSLPISASTGTDALIMASDTYAISDKAKGSYSVSLNGGNLHPNYAKGSNSLAEGMDTKTYGNACHSEGYGTKAGVENNINIQYAHAEGDHTEAKGTASHAEGSYTIANNWVEHASGRYNNSVSASTTFGDSGNTLFSVGNGTADNARHNAFEIRQNGDIYLTKDGQDVKLQDQLGGGVNVVQTTGTSTTDVMSQNAVSTKLSGYVTTDTAQDITAAKTFLWNDSNKKPIIFKQTTNNVKLGFILQNSASTNNELATFEFRPDTYTDSSSVKHPLLYLGHYRNTAVANAGIPQTMVGFRQYDQSGAAAYHYLMPLPSEAKTPFSLTTSFKNYFAPLGFKNGSTMITTDNTGVVDLSSELGGLKLKKLTQAQYDALSTKDSNTLYVIVN